MELEKYIKEKYPKGLNYEFTNEEKAGYLAAIEDVKQALSLGAVSVSVCGGCKKPLHDGLCGSCCSSLASGMY